MKKAVLPWCMFLAMLCTNVLWAFQTPITTHEMLLWTDSMSAKARTAGPVTAGLPLADSMNISSVNQLGLSGTPVGQFRVLQRWASGNIKWVLCDFQADVAARQKNTSIALTDGSGNFGGTDLAVETDSTINVSTGAADFRVRKHRFNLIDYASVGGRELVSPGRSRGIVLKGAFGGDTRLFMSSLDSLDTVRIEENGPARACIRAYGVHRASDGARHFNYVVRMHFYKGKSDVAVYYSLANASKDEPANGWTEWVHLEVPVNVPGAKSFTFSAHDSEVSGTVSGTGASLYQGRPEPGQYIVTIADWYTAPYDWPGGGPTPDKGYVIQNNGTVLKQGDSTQFAKRFYGDVSAADGYGVTGAIERAAGWWPKSIGIDSSGVLSFGVFPKENSAGFYKFNFGKHNTSKLLLSFHGAGHDPNAATAKFQYPLVAKAPMDWYNQSNALFEKLISPAQEDSFFTALFGRPYNPFDKVVIGTWSTGQTPLDAAIYRMFYTGEGGGLNQHCFSRQAMYNFLRDDRVVWAGTYYSYGVQRIRYMNDWAMFRADDFNVNKDELPELFDGPTSGYTWLGYIADTNLTGCSKCNYDGEHKHWNGSTLLYLQSGDERVMEAIKSYGNYEKNMDLYRWWSWDRGGAMHIQSLTDLFTITGDSSYYDSLVSRVKWEMLNSNAHPDLNPNILGANATAGMWWERGIYIPMAATDSATGWYASSLFCKALRYRAVLQAYHAVAFDDPIKDDFRDLLNGFGHFIETEMWYNFTTSTSELSSTGSVGYPYGYYLLYAPDTTQKNSYGYPTLYGYSPGIREDFYVQTINNQLWEDTMALGSWFYWECRLFEVPPGAGGMLWYKSYPGMMYAIHQQIHPERNFVWRPLTVNAEDQGSGTWRLSWTVPEGATYYQIKYSDKPIVEWLNFNQYTRQYQYDPAQYTAFYHAENLSSEPIPLSSGSAQEMTVTGLTAGQTYYFAAKFYNGPVSDGSVAVERGRDNAAGDLSLTLCPNPCNPSTAIRFHLPVKARLEVAVFDLKGRKIAVLNHGELRAGPHRLTWQGRDRLGRAVGSGIYIVKVHGPKRTLTRKLVMCK